LELQAKDIGASRTSIPAELRDSPQYVSEALSERIGEPVVVKIESTNPIGCFKGRGSWLAVGQLAREGSISRDVGIVTASSGNFGQGVAYAARPLGIPVTVFVQENANPAKLERMRRLGARVIVAEPGSDLHEASFEFASQRGQYHLLDGRHPFIATGAGTIAVELTDAIDAGHLPRLVSAFIPVGDGALITGIGTWLRHASPATRIVGVQSEAAPAMTLSWRAKRPIDAPASSFADGIDVASPNDVALTAMEHVVDDMRLVSETSIRTAQAELTADLGLTVEGAAAAAWAAIRADPQASGPTLIVITGSTVRPGELRWHV
jgi:threonine dehydratase